MPHASNTEPAGHSPAQRLIGILGAFAALPSTALMLLDLWANSKAGAAPSNFLRSMNALALVPVVAFALAGLLVLGDLAHALVVPPPPSSGEASPSRLARLTWRLGAVLTAGYLFARGAWFWFPLGAPGRAPADVREQWIQLATTTTLGVPLPAYLWMLALAAMAVHLGRATARLVTRHRHAATHASDDRRAAMAGALVALVIFLQGSGSVLLLATGWRPLLAPSHEPPGACIIPDAAGSASPASTTTPER